MLCKWLKLGRPKNPYLTVAGMIPLGDIDLRREIKLNRETGVVERHRRCIRSVYSAKIGGLSDMTVALYQGDGAEEVNIANYLHKQ